MKNALFLLILSCLSTLTCLSQEKGSFNLSIGGALPVGQFGSKDANSTTSGLAKFGGLAELSYSHPVGKDKEHFGLTIGLRARTNGIDNNANIDPLSAAFPDFTWSVSSAHWKTYSLMGGAYYLFMKSAKIDIRGELSIGAANAYVPAMTITGLLDTAQSGPSALIKATSNKAHATTFTGMAKMGVVFHLNKRLDLLANLDFWYLQPTFTITENVVYAQGFVMPGNLSLSNATSISQQSETKDFKQPMNTLNLTVGVAYKL